MIYKFWIFLGCAKGSEEGSQSIKQYAKQYLVKDRLVELFSVLQDDPGIKQVMLVL